MVLFHNWPLAAIATTGLMFSGWKTAKNGWQLLHNERPSDSEQPQPELESPEFIGTEIRGNRFRYISRRELAWLLHRFSDLIFLDLRGADQWDALQLRAPVTAFRVRRHELADILERLPENRVVVFYGVTDLDALVIDASSRAKAEAPIFVLDHESQYPEGA